MAKFRDRLNLASGAASGVCVLAEQLAEYAPNELRRQVAHLDDTNARDVLTAVGEANAHLAIALDGLARARGLLMNRDELAYLAQLTEAGE